MLVWVGSCVVLFLGLVWRRRSSACPWPGWGLRRAHWVLIVAVGGLGARWPLLLWLLLLLVVVRGPICPRVGPSLSLGPRVKTLPSWVWWVWGQGVTSFPVVGIRPRRISRTPLTVLTWVMVVGVWGMRLSRAPSALLRSWTALALSRVWSWLLPRGHLVSAVEWVGRVERAL